MGLISMLIASTGLFAVLLGLVLFIIAIVLDIIMIIRGCRKKKIHAALIVFAILFNISGFVLFVLPACGFSVLGQIGHAQKVRQFENIENKLYVDDPDDIGETFEYKGMELTKANFLTTGSILKFENPDGAIVFPSEKYYPIYSLGNEMDFDIYYVDGVSMGVFCNSAQYNDIHDHYMNSDNLTLSATTWADGKVNTLKPDFDPMMVVEIDDVCRDSLDIVNGNKPDLTAKYFLTVYSKDRLFSRAITILIYQDKILLEMETGGGGFHGVVLTGEYEQYVRDHLLSNS